MKLNHLFWSTFKFTDFFFLLSAQIYYWVPLVNFSVLLLHFPIPDFPFGFFSIMDFPSCQDAPCGVGPVEVELGWECGVPLLAATLHMVGSSVVHGGDTGPAAFYQLPRCLIHPEPGETGLASPCPTPVRLCPDLENHGLCCLPESPRVLWNECFFQWLLCRFWLMLWLPSWGRGSAELLIFDY